MSGLRFFDVHTHTQFAAYAEDQDAVIQRAFDAGVWMINVGTQKDTSADAVQTAHRFPEGVFATVGLHPIHTEVSYHDTQELGGEKGFTSRGEEFDYEYYKRLAQDKKVVAIGECGLDYYRLDGQSKEKQKTVFEQQIQLAYEIKKPLMVHCRNAFSDLIAMFQVLDSKSQASGVIHFFSGSVADAKILRDLGFYFSFGGVITFARDYDEVIRYIPIERILLETDAPYVTPVPFRGKRNEPVYVVEVAKKMAELKDLFEEEVARITTQNTRQLFQV